MTKDIADLFLRGRITEQEALELTNSRKKLDEDITKSCLRMGAALTTMKQTYGNVPKRHRTKYHA